MIAEFLRRRRVFFGQRSHLLYAAINWLYRDADHLTFMNYGYAVGDEAGMSEIVDERLCAGLYHAVAAQADLTGAEVLDVGSGRGGGAAHVHRMHGALALTGCDLTPAAVAFAKKAHAGVPGLDFKQGDAMSLPFGDRCFDAVLNVESAHCYPDRPRFFRESWRVLKPGGSFLFADFTPPLRDPATEQAVLLAELAEAGFTDLRVTDITAGIILALDLDEARRKRAIRERFPPGTRQLAELWAGTRASGIYRDFVEGKRGYFMVRAVRPETDHALIPGAALPEAVPRPAPALGPAAGSPEPASLDV